jgi:CBS domain-containing protein
MSKEQITTVEQAMSAPSDMVSPSTPAIDLQRRFEAETLRGLIVSEGSRPVGIITWEAVQGDDAATRTVGELMRHDPPVVSVGATLAEARSALHDIDDDVIAVVDANGFIVGELLRDQVRDLEVDVDSATAVISSTNAELLEPTVTLAKGMRVIDSERDDFGEIQDVVLDEYGRITHIDVHYGLIGRHTKRLPVDDIVGYGDNEVYLGMAKSDVDRLPDVEH